MLELGFKMRVAWSERGLGLGLGMGVTMGQSNNSGDGDILHPQKAGCSQGAQQSCSGLVKTLW